mmetsp:Transcript_38389/g.83508  ORF Transcript_38389/g.83508 Transcript_38389/m.83508 type:complete len:240 (+) Transcript_38389:2193-2912(+)
MAPGGPVLAPVRGGHAPDVQPHLHVVRGDGDELLGGEHDEEVAELLAHDVLAVAQQVHHLHHARRRHLLALPVAARAHFHVAQPGLQVPAADVAVLAGVDLVKDGVQHRLLGAHARGELLEGELVVVHRVVLLHKVRHERRREPQLPRVPRHILLVDVAVALRVDHAEDLAEAAVLFPPPLPPAAPAGRQQPRAHQVPLLLAHLVAVVVLDQEAVHAPPVRCLNVGCYDHQTQTAQSAT